MRYRSAPLPDTGRTLAKLPESIKSKLIILTPSSVSINLPSGLSARPVVEVSFGPIAQLVERYTGSVEVSGSTPLRSILSSRSALRPRGFAPLALNGRSPPALPAKDFPLCTSRSALRPRGFAPLEGGLPVSFLIRLNLHRLPHLRVFQEHRDSFDDRDDEARGTFTVSLTCHVELKETGRWPKSDRYE